MAKYFYSFEGRTLGPASPKEIMNLILDDVLTTDSYVMESHSQQWVKINQLPDMMRFLHESDIRLSFNEKDGDSVLAEDKHTAQFFHYPLRKVILWSILSFGWFEIYWLYRNWHFLRYYRKGKTSLNFWRDVINPFAIVGIFDSIACDKELLKHGGRQYFSTNGWLWYLSLLALVVFSLLLAYVPHGFSVLLETIATVAPLLFSILFILPVQRHINAANTGDKRDMSQTGLGLIVLIVIGGFGWLTTIWQIVTALVW